MNCTCNKYTFIMKICHQNCIFARNFEKFRWAYRFKNFGLSVCTGMYLSVPSVNFEL